MLEKKVETNFHFWPDNEHKNDDTYDYTFKQFFMEF